MSQTETTPKACQALLWDQSTHCSKQAGGKGLYCPEHGSQYASLTQAYKELSAKRERLHSGKLEQKMSTAWAELKLPRRSRRIENLCCAWMRNASADHTVYEAFQRK